VIELAQRVRRGSASTTSGRLIRNVLWQEPFVIYSQILSSTKSRIMVGPMVTNPLSRHWAVTASLFATLNDMYGNRDRLRHWSRATRPFVYTGGTPATLGHVGPCMHVIKELAEGREAVRFATPR
jgi:hypothetical protein